LTCAAICLTGFLSCEKTSNESRSGELVSFSAKSVGNVISKAKYTGNVSSGEEAIYWESGDIFRIFCPDGWYGEEQNKHWLEPESSVSDSIPPYGDYRIIDFVSGDYTKATLELNQTDENDATGVRWSNEPGKKHYFYGVFPSPSMGGITTDIYALEPKVSAIKKQKIEANLYSNQYSAACTTSSGKEKTTGDTQILKADFKWMLMSAFNGPYVNGVDDGSNVKLDFKPLTTAIEFTIKNDYTSGNMVIKSVELISDATQISGAFTIPDCLDADSDGYPKIPAVTPAVDSQKVVKLVLPDSKLITVSKGNYFRFTLFLAPIAKEVNDLRFRITRSDGSTLTTRLGYTDGTGVTFPRSKKSFVTGLFVPDAAQWVIDYEPIVTPWIKGDGEDLELN